MFDSYELPMRHYYLTFIVFLISGWIFNKSISGNTPDLGRSTKVDGLDLKDCGMSLHQVTQKLESFELSLDQMQQSYQLIKQRENLELNKKLNRYQNGIDIIKLLYEKLLDLDHHLTSINTFNDIHDLTNLNNYPEFIEVREALIKDTRQKSSIALPPFLQQNIFVTMGYTLLSSVFGEGNMDKRNDDINNIACLLDFTVSMQSDLKMIYYETEFLHQATRDIQDRCFTLFNEYTIILDYNKTIQWCRENDDWGLLDKRIETLKSTMIPGIKLDTDSLRLDKNIEISNDIEFQITRLIGLMEAYDNLIRQGINYYSKFKTILDNYENEDSCVGQLPDEIVRLKKKIDLSITKYTTAYNLAELQGSGLKNLLFSER